MARDADGNYTGPGVKSGSTFGRGNYSGPKVENRTPSFGRDGYDGPQVDNTPTFRRDGYNGPQISGGSTFGGGRGNVPSFGDNPLGFVFGNINRYALDPLTDHNRNLNNFERSKGRLWQSRGFTAQAEGRYYQQDARRDAFRDNQDTMYDIEAAKLGRAAARQGVMMGPQGNTYGQAPQGGYAPIAQNPNFGGYYGQSNPYAPGFHQPLPNASYQAPAVQPPAQGASVAPAPQAPVVNTPLQTVRQPDPAQQAPVGASSQPAPTTQSTTTGVTTPEVKPEPKVEALAVPAGSGKKAKAFNEKFPALPADDNQIMDIQRNLIAAGFEVGPKLGEADGKSGRRTWTAFETICAQAKPPIDPRAVNFRDPNDADTKRFNEVLNERIAQHQASKQPVAAPQQQGPTPEQLAEQQAAAARAQAEAQRRAGDAREVPVLLNTAYDSRNLATMDGRDRYDLARQTLLAIGELKSEDKQHTLENMHDKMKEAVRKANKEFGTTFSTPSEGQPFTNDAMTALGLIAAKRGELGYDLGAAVYDKKTANHAADTVLDALRIRGGSLSERVATFEGQARLPQDGRVDPDMLRAAQAVYAQNAGLAVVGVRGGEAVAPTPDAAALQTTPPVPNQGPSAPQK